MVANLVEIFARVAARKANEPALVWRDRVWTYAELQHRYHRFARALARRGYGCRRERAELESWESGQDAVALYLHNGNEYLEAMMGALAARATAVNVNYRYVANELAYLLRNSAARVLVYHATFAPTVAKVRGDLPELELLVQVDDDSHEALLDEAIPYERFLDGETTEPLDLPRSADDLFVIYTGGTTGLPKGVLWRQEDIFFNLFGGHLPGFPRLDTDEALDAHVDMGIGGKIIVAMPFMHGAGVGACFNTWHRGGTVVLPDENRRLDPESYWSAVERHAVDSLMLIGDAFALPLAAALKRKSYDTSAVRIVTSTAAVLSATAKADLLAGLPEHVMVIESVGSTETGLTAMSTLVAADAARDTSYDARAGTVLLSADQSRILDPMKDCGEIGWTARTGELPLGYLGDEKKTRETFVTLAGARYAIAGDRARYDDDGKMVLLGRESQCVNTGGEKVYVEEVERVVKTHPAILDALVVGRPSDRWGQEVTAIVSLREGESAPTVDALRAHCAPHLAGYKLPRAIVVAPAIIPLANGKPDYAWAKEIARSCSPTAIRS